MKNGDYILIKAPKDYIGKKYRELYCYEHHYVWCKYNNISIPVGYVIHHKDGNKLNNTISNLELISKKNHSKLHHKGKDLSKDISISCVVCNKIFEVKIRVSKKRKFCSRKCMGYSFGKLHGHKRKPTPRGVK
jgi:hypothetical protein